jgi:hypothetical protein
MELFWPIVIAGVAIALAVCSAGLVIAHAVRAFTVVFAAALRTPSRFIPNPHSEDDDEDEIREHLPPWANPTALEVVAWNFRNVTDALFAIRNRIGGPASTEKGKP